MDFILSKYFIRFLTISLLIFLVLKPYNWFCNYSQKCQPIYLSDFLPTFEGNKQVTIIPQAKSYNKYLKFEALTESFRTVSGRKNTIKFRVKNLTQSYVKFRPEFYIDPQDYDYYIIRQNCLCFEEIILKKNEERELVFSFKVRKDFDTETEEKPQEEVISIGYSIDK